MTRQDRPGDLETLQIYKTQALSCFRTLVSCAFCCVRYCLNFFHQNTLFMAFSPLNRTSLLCCPSRPLISLSPVHGDVNTPLIQAIPRAKHCLLRRIPHIVFTVYRGALWDGTFQKPAPVQKQPSPVRTRRVLIVTQQVTPFHQLLLLLLRLFHPCSTLTQAQV